MLLQSKTVIFLLKMLLLSNRVVKISVSVSNSCVNVYGSIYYDDYYFLVVVEALSILLKVCHVRCIISSADCLQFVTTIHGLCVCVCVIA